MFGSRYIPLKGASRFERTYAWLATRRIDIVIVIGVAIALRYLLKIVAEGINESSSLVIAFLAMMAVAMLVDWDIKRRNTIMRVPRRTYRTWHKFLKELGYKGKNRAADHFLNAAIVARLSNTAIIGNLGFSGVKISDDDLRKFATDFLNSQNTKH